MEVASLLKTNKKIMHIGELNGLLSRKPIPGHLVTYGGEDITDFGQAWKIIYGEGQVGDEFAEPKGKWAGKIGLNKNTPPATLFEHMKFVYGKETEVPDSVREDVSICLAAGLEPEIHRKPATYGCAKAAAARVDEDGVVGVELDRELKSLLYDGTYKGQEVLIAFHLPADRKFAFEDHEIISALREKVIEAGKQADAAYMGLIVGRVNPLHVTRQAALHGKEVVHIFDTALDDSKSYFASLLNTWGIEFPNPEIIKNITQKAMEHHKCKGTVIDAEISVNPVAVSPETKVTVDTPTKSRGKS